ncbi:MAG: siderophore-interacting protein [Acidimicrobiia bacterium]|nr:siderophore-interacting protein [Acidimicrobiia bacterium]
MSDVVRLRRPPPDFRRAVVTEVALRTPRLATITLTGPELVGFEVDEPAASLRLLLPRGGVGTSLEVPEWDGNEFRFADGARPPIRTLTPLAVDAAVGSVEVDVVLHGEGALSTWAAAQPVGDQVAVSGPGRGYEVDPDAERFLVVGDESALPAIGQLLGVLPQHAHIDVIVEVGDTAARIDLPAHPGADVRWCDLGADDAPGSAMLREVEGLSTPDGVRVWAAGEAAGVQRLRNLLSKERGLPRSQTVIRGYWKHGRTGAG